MLCQKCQKNNASVHMMQNINGVVTEHHLCSECANLAQNNFEDFSKKMFSNMFSNNFFSNDDFFKGNLAENSGFVALPSFFNEGLKTREYDEYVLPDIKPVKIKESENDMSNAKKILTLKKELKHAVKKEEYEKAAKLRDKIKELEG